MASAGRIDVEQCRLRHFVDRLRAAGELDVHDEPLAPAQISAPIEATASATRN